MADSKHFHLPNFMVSERLENKENNFVWAIAHMDGPSSSSQVITTEMVADELVEVASFKKPPQPDQFSHDYASIREFMARPYELYDAAWTQAGVANVNLQSFSISSVITGNQTWMNKLAGYNLIRGTAVIRLQLNANPFQQGKLLLHYVPCYQHNPSAPSLCVNLLQKTLHPGIEIDCRESEVILKVPYLTPSLYYDLNRNFYDWGQVFVTILSPLQMDPATTSTTVQYSMWLSFEDFEVAAPVPVVAHMDKEAKALSNRPISTGLKAAGTIFNSIGNIPGLASYSKPLEWAAAIAAKMAYSLGYSKPPLTDSITYVNDQGNRYTAVSDGVDLALPLSLTSGNQIKNSSDISIRSEDEMSFAFLKSRWAYYTAVPWQTDAVPANILTLSCGPTQFFTVSGYTAGGHTMTCKTYIPSSHLAQSFALWRGGYEVCLKFAKTQFHSGRLELVWTPDTIATGTQVQNIGAMRTIVDLRYSDEITIKLPWLQGISYTGISEPSGTFYINILNSLKAPSNVSTSVNILVFIRAADDFELAQPTQVISAKPVFALPFADLGVHTIGGQKSLPLTTDFAESSAGEQFTSIRQLLLRYNFVWPTSSTGLTYTFCVNPYFFEASSMSVSTGAIIGPTWGGGPFSKMGSMYAFYRGGMRVMQGLQFYPASSTASNPVWTCSILDGPAAGYTTAIGQATHTTTLSWNNPANAATALDGCSFVKMNATQVYTRVPYYVPTKFSLVQNMITDTFPTSADAPTTYANCYMNMLSTAPVNEIARAIADDFQFGFFIATPLIASSYS